MVAIGPDFKKGFMDETPVSNADVGKTLAEILKLDIPIKGKLIGRVLSEAMSGGKAPKFVLKREIETWLARSAHRSQLSDARSDHIL